MTTQATPAAASAPAPATPETTAAAAAPAPAAASAAPAPQPAPKEEPPLFKNADAPKPAEVKKEETKPAPTPKADPPEADTARAAATAWQQAKEEADKADPAAKEAKQKAADDLKTKAKAALEAWKKLDPEAAGKAEAALENPAAAAPSYEDLRKAGIKLTDEHFKELDSYAGQKKLTPDQVAILRQHQSDLQEQATAKWQETQKAWLHEIETDPEFGGDRFRESSEGAKRVLDKFGNDKLKEILERGFGNHPDFNRMLMAQYWAGLANDNYQPPTPGAAKPGPKTRQQEDADLFPTMAKQLSGELDNTPVE